MQKNSAREDKHTQLAEKECKFTENKNKVDEEIWQKDAKIHFKNILFIILI